MPEATHVTFEIDHDPVLDCRGSVHRLPGQPLLAHGVHRGVDIRILDLVDRPLDPDAVDVHPCDFRIHVEAGDILQVPTPTGEVAVKVPAGATSGTKLRLRGRGVQAKSGPGDLYLVLRPTPPSSDDPEVLAAVEVLEKAYAGSVRDELRL